MKTHSIYKTLAALLVLVAAAALPARAVELTYDWGRGEVQEDHALGPGMWYTKIVYPTKPVIIWFVEVDLSNPYAKVEQVQSRHQVPDVARWDVMTHYRENTREGHRVMAAWNHDFFSYDGGVCIGINISEGEMTWHKWGRSLLAISDQGKASVFYPSLDAHVKTADGTTVEIDFFNSAAYGLSGDCLLFNRLNGLTLTEDGNYISVEPLDPWRVNGAPVRCRVKEVSTTPLQTTRDGSTCVLYLRNGKRNALDGHVAPGDIVEVHQSFRNEGWGFRPENILNAFHGYPSIVRGGVLHEGEFNNFENGREYEKSSRVMAGISQDGTKFYIATTEMSGASTGVDCIELSAWMVEHGAWDVVNFDSGGSAAIVIDGEMLNLPGRGSIRPVVDAALAVSLAPVDETVHHMAFSLRAIEPVVMSRTPLRLLGLNQYDEIVDGDLAGCTFECDPPEIGYVDAEGVFHSALEQATGRIIARKDGMEAELAVATRPVTNLKSVYSTLLIDGYPHAIAGIKGEADGLTVDIDPGSLTWTAEPEGILSIDDGMVSGLANGHATLRGAVGDLSFEIGVDVELSEPQATVFTCSDPEAAGITASSTLKNLTYSTTDLPAQCADGIALDFDLSAGRSSTIKVSPAARLYSLPQALEFTFDDPAELVSKVTFAVTDAQNKRLNYTIEPVAGQTVLPVSFRTPDNIEYWQYPLTLKTITFYLKNTARPASRISLGRLEAFYPGYSGIGAPALAPSAGSLTARLGAETLTALLTAATAGPCIVALHDIAGRTIAVTSTQTASGTTAVDFDIKALPPGIYILSASGTVNASRKLTIR